MLFVPVKQVLWYQCFKTLCSLLAFQQDLESCASLFLHVCLQRCIGQKHHDTSRPGPH